MKLCLHVTTFYIITYVFGSSVYSYNVISINNAVMCLQLAVVCS